MAHRERNADVHPTEMVDESHYRFVGHDIKTRDLLPLSSDHPKTLGRISCQVSNIGDLVSRLSRLLSFGNMSRATSEEQLNFLLSCVRHANNGKVSTKRVFIQVSMLTAGRSISSMWLKNAALSVKAPRRVILPKSAPLCTDIQSRAKRYERLLKGKGISPNGGPDLKPLPPIGNTRKVTKRKPKDNTAKTRAKRQKMVKLAEKETSKPTTAIEGIGYPVVPKASSPVSRLSMAISTPHESCFEMPPANEDFDFNDFCSPEMFAHCAPDARELAPTEQSAPSSILPLETNAVGHGSGTPPQVVSEEPKRETKAERETVIIAD